MIRIESSYFEAYTFEDFDLNGDGYITREEFNEAKFPNCCGGNSMKFPTFGDWQRTVWIYANSVDLGKMLDDKLSITEYICKLHVKKKALLAILEGSVDLGSMVSSQL